MKKKLTQVASLSSALSGLVGLVARFLPRSIGEPLRQMTSGAQRASSTATSGVSRVDAVKKSAGKVSDSGEKAKKKADKAASTGQQQADKAASAGQQKPEPAPAPAGQPETEQPPAGRREITPAPNGRTELAPTTAPVAPARQERVQIDPNWVQTPYVQPGESLTVDLLIRPVRPHPANLYAFKVMSRSLEQPDASLVVQEGSVQITSRPWLQRAWSILVIIVGLALIIGVTVLVEYWLLSPLLLILGNIG